MKQVPGEAVDRLRRIVEEPDLSTTRYRLLEKIGSGGMSDVYLVYDAELERQVALKVLQPLEMNTALTWRMLREAKIIAGLEHPAIVPVHDAGTLPDGRVFYVMKYVQGQRLDVYAATLTTMSERLRTFQRICEGVAFAHSRGAIHRDLKPENIMVGPFGEVQIMDWGLSKMRGDSVPELSSDLPRASGASLDTTAGTVMGTPRYMAPEQARGESHMINERSDIFSLGGILYFLLTLKPPETTITPRQLNPRIPRSLEAICLKAMSEHQAHRYKTATEFSSDISSYLNRLPVMAYRENIFERTARWVSKNSFLLILILTYLLVRVLVFLFTRR